MQNTKVSYYRNVQDVIGQQVTLAKILEGIRTGNNGKWIPAIEKLRSTQDEAEQKKHKGVLPCFTASGLFTRRSAEGLVVHSGFILLDFDDKDNPALSEQGDKIRQRLTEDKHTAFLFLSCRGKGLAVGVRIDKIRHAESFKALENYYKETYGLIVDKGCKDVSRLRFVSYDMGIHINESSAVFSVPEIASKQIRPPYTPDASDDDRRIIQSIIASGKPLSGIDEYHVWLNVGFAIANTFGVSGREYFHALSRGSSKYDQAGCDEKYDNCLNTNRGEITFGSVVHLAKESGIEVGNTRSAIQEMIENTTTKTPFDEIKEILRRIAGVEFESERSKYIHDLSGRTGISRKSLSKDIEALSVNTSHSKVADSESIAVAHPGYEVKDNFMSLGFRETVIKHNKPEDRNIFIVATKGGYELCDDAVFQCQDGDKLIFDIRERTLTHIGERWGKLEVLAFVNEQTIPNGLYLRIKQTLKDYVELQEESHYGLLASWIMATYFHRCFYAMPFLFFYGKKGCGKTRILDITERLSFNAIKTKGLTVASLADSIDGVRGTLLVDQAESLSDPKNLEILGLLADSYTVGGGKRRVVHISNKARRVLEFETYSPKAFAAIKEIDVDLKDRCILLTMVRASKEYPYPDTHLPIWKNLRGELYRLLLTKWKDVKEIYQTTGEGVSHRVRELWRPIETILKLEKVSQEEMQDIKQAFLNSMQETQVELSDHESELFDTLLEMMSESGERVFTVDEIAKRLHHDEGMSEKAMQTWVGRTIGQLSLYTQKVGRKNKKRAYQFNIDHVEKIRNRYTPQTGGIGGHVVFAQQNQGNPGDHLKNTGGHEVVSSGREVVPDNGDDTTCDHMRPHAILTCGQAQSLTGQGRAGAIPPIPLKIGTSKKNISNVESVEKLDTETEGIPEVEFVEEIGANV